MSNQSSPFLPKSLRVLLLAASIGLVPSLAHAERADRNQKMEVESDQPGKVDLQNQVVTFNGNVVVTKGTMQIKAGRMEVRESAEGYQSATAIATPGQLATFRQKRDGIDEYIEGEAERLDYDSKADTIRFTGKASVRRLRGTTVADEARGAVITYDNTAEVVTVAGGPSAATPSNPGGRVTVILTPKSASAPEPAASGARP